MNVKLLFQSPLGVRSKSWGQHPEDGGRSSDLLGPQEEELQEDGRQNEDTQAYLVLFFMFTKPSKYWKYKYNTQAYLVLFFMLTKPSKYWKYKYNTQAYLVLFLIFSKPSKYWRKKLKTLKQNYCTGVQKWMKLLWFLQCEYFGHLILNFELLLFKMLWNHKH